MESIASSSTEPETGISLLLDRLAERHQEEGDPVSAMITEIRNMTTTENGAGAFKSSQNSFVDLFYETLRGVSTERLVELFHTCWNQNVYLTLRICAYVRDCRGGKGERSIGRTLFQEICKKDSVIAQKNAHLFLSEYGRWDDGIDLEGDYVDIYVKAVVDQLQQDLHFMQIEGEGERCSVSLCAKWIPSEKNLAHRRVYKKIVKAFGESMNYATFRKTILVPLRRKIDLLETKLCEKRYSDIDYEKVPSVAMNIHSKMKLKKGQGQGRGQETLPGCFRRNDPERFEAYVGALTKGEKKINTDMLFPHEIVQNYTDGSGHVSMDIVLNDLTEAQWRTMLEKMRGIGDLGETLVLADVSGSMSGMPMLISYTMGILISSLAKSDVWKEMVLTFESQPRLVPIQGETLLQKIQAISSVPWGGSTNFVGAMQVILDLAVKLGLPQSDIPKRLIVVSDMQFDQADSSYKSSFSVIQKRFEDAGYRLPHIVFWNVRSTKNVPVTASTAGVSLVSGFTPRILEGVLHGSEGDSPWDTLLRTVMVERYDLIQV